MGSRGRILRGGVDVLSSKIHPYAHLARPEASQRSSLGPEGITNESSTSIHTQASLETPSQAEKRVSRSQPNRWMGQLQMQDQQLDVVVFSFQELILKSTRREAQNKTAPIKCGLG